jgi:integrase
MPAKKPPAEPVLMLATADADIGLVPAATARKEAQKLADQERKPIMLRDPVTDRPLALIRPSKRKLSAAEVRRRKKRGAFHQGALTSKRVERLRAPGRYRDSAVVGLHVQISASGARSWILRYQIDRRVRWAGLGSLRDIGLAEARRRARELRMQISAGTDPIEAKRAAKAAKRLAQAKSLSFKEAAQKYAELFEGNWKNKSHRDQFLNSLRTYAFDQIGDLDVGAITSTDVLRILKPIWNEKAVSADRVRARIASILDWAVAEGRREPGINPASWKAQVKYSLPAARKIAPIKHFAAMPYAEVPAFMATLRAREGVAERALEFAILCVSRSNEVIGARRTEVDLGNAIWTVPPERMKKRKEHRVPLSDAAIALLEALPVEQDNPFVFIGTRRDSINKMSLRLALHRIRDDCTVHGMRSSFRDWCGESTNFEREVAEQCLAHRIGDQTEQSYARGTMFDKRRRLMAAWSAFCCSSPVAAAGDNVVTLGGRP